MQKTILAFFSLSLFLFSCDFSDSEDNCRKIHTGSFIYRGNKDKGIPDFLTYRSQSLQIEINQKTGDTTKLSVKWLDDCNYELRILSSTVHFPDSIQKIREKMVLRITILYVTDSCYTYQAESKTTNAVMRDTMWLNK